MNNEKMLTIPPQWKKSFFHVVIACLFFWIEVRWGPIDHLSIRPPLWLLAIWFLVYGLLLLMRVVLSEKNVTIKFLGIPVRNIFWFEISHVVYLKGKYDTSEDMLYLSRYPLLSLDGKAPDLPTRKFLHPVNVIAFYVPHQLKDDCIRIFSERCGNFEIRKEGCKSPTKG